jgi:O-antigen/teichoic acid export membrane protein
MRIAERHHRPPAVTSPSDALRRLFGRGSVYTILLAIQMSTALLVVPFVTRLLTPSAYGHVAAAIVIFTALSIVGAFGLPDAAARTFFAGADGPRLAKRLIAAESCGALVLALFVDIAGPAWAPLFGLSYGGLLRLAVWGGAAGAILLGTQSLLRVEERVWTFMAIALIATVGGQALALTLCALLHTASAYVAGVAAGTATAAVAGLIASGGAGSGVAGADELRSGFALGLPIVPHSFAVSMLASADRILIVAILGLTAAGRYQVAYAVGGLGVALVTALNQAWLPLLLGAREHNRWEILTATSAVVHLVAGLAAVALALIAPLALLIAAPPSYGRSSLVPVAAIVAFSALPYATCGTYFQVVFVSGRTRVMAVAAPLAAAVNIGLNLALLRPIGLVGAAVATAAAYGVLPAVVGVVACRIAPLAQATRDAARTWLLAAPFIAAGALIPAGATGTAVRAGALVIAVIGAGLLMRATARRDAMMLPAQEEAPDPTGAPELSTEPRTAVQTLG